MIFETSIFKYWKQHNFSFFVKLKKNFFLNLLFWFQTSILPINIHTLSNQCKRQKLQILKQTRMHCSQNPCCILSTKITTTTGFYSGNTLTNSDILWYFLWQKLARPNSCPNLAAVWTQSPRPVIPSPNCYDFFSLVLQNLKAAHAQSGKDTSVTTVTRTANLITLVSMCSMRSTGLLERLHCARIKLIMNLSEDSQKH